ncbi:hypothetical protein FRC08_009253 [Ceratobasidium sp. 394]|nr:hypothetical protein FRC08_009253 [Ceratobasidium sp. 394]
MRHPTTPPVLTWHYWSTLLRLFISLAWTVMFVIAAALKASVNLMPVLYSTPFLLMSINDILILTLDYKRTDSYIGTVLTQTIISGLLLAPPATFMGLTGSSDGLLSLAVHIPNSVHILCTLYLSTSLLLSKREAGVHAPWKANAKDVLLGSSSSQCRPSWFGHARNPPLRKRDVSRFPHFWTVYVPKILFRRISPVESKRYAFFQNFCALVFMIAIIVRAIMALAQAQNQIEPRGGAGSCNGLPFIRNVRILVRHQGADVRGINPQTGQGYDVAVQIIATRTGQYQCTSEPQSATRTTNWFQVFNCGSQNNTYSYFSQATYSITIRSTNGTALNAIRLPDIWLANFGDTFRDTYALDQPGFMSNLAPWLVPPWQMIGGKHIEGSIGLVERRFITSSVFRDIVANLKPTYNSVSLFNIATKDATPLTDSLTASALLTPSLVSTLSYLNQPSDFLRIKDGFASMPLICAFIEDYRSSTIFDAIGSVGGLLAILQGVHILLFGRPMFWGLTGAKLISPFGIFGSCHSRGFRRRLRERYHRQHAGDQAGDAAEAIRINAFLRDFVIDFGPADVDEGGEPERNEGRDVYSGAEHNAPRGDDEHDPNDSFLLLPRSKGRQSSRGSTITMETMSSTWEP